MGGLGAVARMAGGLLPYLTKAASNPLATSAITGSVLGGVPSLLRGNIPGAIGGGIAGGIGGASLGGLGGKLVPGATGLVGRAMGPTTSVAGALLPGLAGAAVPVAAGAVGNAVLGGGLGNLGNQAGAAIGGAGQNAIGLLGYHAVTGEPLYGTPVPPGMGQYGGVPPVGGSALDVIQAGGPAGAQRLTTLKNAETMADALNAYLPTVRKFSEQAKKDDFARNMAAAGIRQNIVTNAAMLQAAQQAGLGMGLTGAQQAGQALVNQYQYS